MRINSIEPLYPFLKVNLYKCDTVWDIEGKVHGQMKQYFFDKEIRQQFTKEIQECDSWQDALNLTQKWVTIIKMPKEGGW